MYSTYCCLALAIRLRVHRFRPGARGADGNVWHNDAGGHVCETWSKCCDIFLGQFFFGPLGSFPVEFRPWLARVYLYHIFTIMWGLRALTCSWVWLAHALSSHHPMSTFDDSTPKLTCSTSVRRRLHQPRPSSSCQNGSEVYARQ